ncbi:hypothetical protein [Nostoc sp. NMS8]|uniref:hypothetical protein n=1 Tax=Nostoc sp. NMS8 TaxID=2815392 RepID=UPI0025D4F979|nr:hypothetical protein [Nostoc sp. NMS8]MBN3957357.1 hypothetical protein [Nostoc sp. NMS8]
MVLVFVSTPKRQLSNYFEDIKIGLIAVSADYPSTDAVKYSRNSSMIQLSAPQGNDVYDGLRLRNSDSLFNV